MVEACRALVLFYILRNVHGWITMFTTASLFNDLHATSEEGKKVYPNQDLHFNDPSTCGASLDLVEHPVWLAHTVIATTLQYTSKWWSDWVFTNGVPAFIVVINLVKYCIWIWLKIQIQSYPMSADSGLPSVVIQCCHL